MNKINIFFHNFHSKRKIWVFDRYFRCIPVLTLFGLMGDNPVDNFHESSMIVIKF